MLVLCAEVSFLQCQCSLLLAWQVTLKSHRFQRKPPFSLPELGAQELILRLSEGTASLLAGKMGLDLGKWSLQEVSVGVL